MQIVDELIQEVRDGLDEDTASNITSGRIVRALNRAARSLYNKVAKKLDSVFMKEYPFTAVGGTLVLPNDIYGQRVEFIEILDGPVPRRLQKLHLNQLRKYTSGIAASYSLKGNVVVFDSQKTVTGTLYYMKRPAELTVSLGRVLDSTSSTLTLDSVASSITTDIDSLSAFINVIDQHTGEVKCSLQVADVDDDVIEIKTSSLDRVTVAGYTIATEVDANPDDYVAAISGSCIIEFLGDYSDYVVQHAVVEIRKSLGEQLDGEVALLRDYEKEILSMWAGRDQDKRIEAKNPHWQRTFRRSL